jgi:hypothetical protein
MNIITRAWNGITGFVGRILPADNDKNGIPDSVEQMNAAAEKLLAEFSDLTMADVIAICASLASADIDGKQKHLAAVTALKMLAEHVAAWVFHVAVAAAYGKIMAEINNANSKP